MKTIKELEQQKPIFLNDWEDRDGVIADFEGIYITGEEYRDPELTSEYMVSKKTQFKSALKKHEKTRILFASYSYANYSGDAFVLFIENCVLYEVNGGHCSCMGLEGQWDPEETTIKSLLHRLKEGNLGHNDWCSNEFCAELTVLLT